MGTKITFTKLVTPLESIQVDFGDGEGLKEYNTNEARTNGIAVPDTVEDFAGITIKGQDVQVNELKFLVDSNTISVDSRAKDIIIEDPDKIDAYTNQFRTVIFKDTIENIPNLFCQYINILRLPRNLKNADLRYIGKIGTLYIPDDIDYTSFSGCFAEKIICSDTYPIVKFYNDSNELLQTILIDKVQYSINSKQDYTNIYLNKSVTLESINKLRDGINYVQNIDVDNKNPYLKVTNNILYSKDGTNLVLYPPSKTDNSFEVPEGVNTISSSAFYNNEHLSQISLPSSITNIGESIVGSTLVNIIYNGSLSDFNNITFGSYTEDVKKKMLAQALNHTTLSLTEFSTLLNNNEVDTTPENPISPTITPASADGLWTHDELQALSDLIKTKKVYIDLRNTDLKHEYEKEITQGLIEEEEDGGIWGDEDNSKYCTSEAGTESIRAFPGVFANNTYLVGINMPETDNYTVNTVFKDCTNLKHVGFSGTELWKIGKLTDESGAEDDDYYIWYGMDNFVHKLDSWITVLDTEEEAMAILRSGAGLMWYYDYWVDYQSNPGEITTRPASNEIELTGLRNVSSAVVMHLNEDVTVDETTIPAANPEEPDIKVASIDYNDDVTIKNGIVQL